MLVVIDTYVCVAMATVEEVEALKAQVKQLVNEAEEMRLERIGLGETIKKQVK